MKGDITVIQHLNKILGNELVAINQYFLHARMYEDWGLKKLGAHEYRESIDEMKHADKLIKRILFLEGAPNLADRMRLRIAGTVFEGLKNDLALEIEGRKILVDGVKQCEAAGDYVSRELLVELLEDTETHIDFLETQISLTGSLGEQNYLQSAMGEISDGSEAAG